ncbi:prepilin peptidase, partial [Mycolicibacterium insubricum]|nr:prepilin peptidase [Mycolicibacterium insubricum]
MAILSAAAAGVWLILLTVADLRTHRLPNVLTLPGAGVILA